MKRFASVTSQLYEELEVLADLESALTRMQNNNTSQAKVHEFRQKVMWQREEVNGLREMSTWVRTYDYVVRLLVRSLFTIIERVKGVFGIKTQMGSREKSHFVDNSISALVETSVCPPELSLGRSVSNLGDKGKKSRILTRVCSFRRCMTSKTYPPVIFQTSNGFFKKQSFKTQNPTLGNAALALHYANVIIFIEKLAISPHFITPEARVDLYHMLTSRIKNSLRAKLNLFSKSEAYAVYNRDLASEWSSLMGRTLDWVGPLAHNMIKWHSERNFEKQGVDSGGNVLLVNTLFYADQEKSEDAIMELVMGLHYISRFGREINDKAFAGLACGDYLLHKSTIASITL